jgi:hypothetical protein
MAIDNSELADIALRLRALGGRIRREDAPQAGPGPEGPQGPTGPMGPMPSHEWRGTELRFELAPGQWGQWTDLQGPAGETRVVHVGGGGGAVVIQSGYFPGGWA